MDELKYVAAPLFTAAVVVIINPLLFPALGTAKNKASVFSPLSFFFCDVNQLIFSRVPRDSTPRYVRPSVGQLVGR